MKRLAVLIALVLFLGSFSGQVSHAMQRSSCASVTNFFATCNPIGVGSSTAACVHVTNCGDRQKQFQVEFTDALPSGAVISIGSATLSLYPGQTLIVCTTYPNVQEAGLHTLKVEVFSHKDLLASATAGLAVN